MNAFDEVFYGIRENKHSETEQNSYRTDKQSGSELVGQYTAMLTG